jgi:hypothetical protein
MRSFLRNLSLSVLSKAGRRNLLCFIGNSLPFRPDCRFAEHPALCARPGLCQYRSSAGLPVWLL